MKKHLLVPLAFFCSFLFLQAQDDPYLWLEEVDGEKALEFVEKQNKSTIEKLSQIKEYDEIYEKNLEMYNSSDRIIYPNTNGAYVYNFWKGQDHIRGIWRRSSKDNYINGKPDWETLFDLDKMSEEDDINWVFKGSSGLYPTYNRFLIRLSKGGGDAVVTREFDANKKSFVDEGFYIDESKGSASYLDENSLVVSSDFGENTMTSSGYPRQVKLWKRGTSLKQASLLYEGDSTVLGCFGGILRDGDLNYIMVSKYLDIFTSQTVIINDNKPILLDIPNDSQINAILSNQLIVELKSEWTINDQSYSQGSVISLNFTELLAGNHKVKLIFEPDDFTSVSAISTTKTKLLLNLLRNVSSELYVVSFDGNEWNHKKVDAPEFGTISVRDLDQFSDQYYFSYSNFLTPTTLYIADAESNNLKPLKSLKAYFDGNQFEVKQHQVKSKDGTMIPYYIIHPKDIIFDGNSPTLLNAYGGFGVSRRPFYSGTIGNAWLNNGGVFVLANIRGGGEFGPQWHQAGIKEKRQNVYDDFHAVAEDLIDKKITSSEHLGIMGGSNGGLLVGVAFTQRPDLYNAIVCQVPLLDMKRYNKLLAGASWMGEYGNPDIPEEWEYIQKYSPYHNLKKDVDYPEVFFYTSTRDDRVHPGHARKMVAKMNDMGNTVLYYENVEGGHGGASTNEQSARMWAMTYSYLLMKLKYSSVKQ